MSDVPLIAVGGRQSRQGRSGAVFLILLLVVSSLGAFSGGSLVAAQPTAGPTAAHPSLSTSISSDGPAPGAAHALPLDDHRSGLTPEASVKVIGTIPVGTEPYDSAFDPGNGDVYVPNAGSNDVSVISGATNEVVATVHVGTYPYCATYDSGNGYVYVPNYGSATVSVINGATNAVVATVPVGSAPYLATYDSGNGYVYVPNSGSDSVSVINGTSNAIAATVPGGSAPFASTYDPGNGYVYVSNMKSDNVSVIDGATAQVVATVSVGSTPLFAAYDSGNGYLYVPNGYSANVSVISGTTNTVVATVPVGSGPNYATYDSGNGYVYVPSTGLDDVSVISGATDKVVATVAVGSTPFVATYDSGDGYVYVPNYGSTTVSVINGATDKVVATVSAGSTPHFATYDSGNDYVYVTNEGSANVSVLGPTRHAVTFTETGLPAGTEWWVNVTGQAPQVSTTASITLNLTDRAYTYAVSTIDKMAEASGGSFTVNGSAVSEPVAFTPVTYAVTFTETGLPAGANWSVSIQGISYPSTTSTITCPLTNGTYPFSLGPIVGWTPRPRVGTVTVDGGAASEAVAWARVTYTVAFSEFGLPSGTEWWINVTGGASNSSTGDALSLLEPDGLYNCSVATADKTYSSLGLSFVVDGMGVSEEVTFVRVSYGVTFTGTGLPSGTAWAVTFGGAAENGTGNLTFPGIANGTYPFAVGTEAGYTATPNSGSVFVHGAAASESISFARAVPSYGNGTSPATFLGLPIGEGYGVVGGVFIAILVVTMIVVMMRRHGGKTPSEAPKTPSRPNAGEPPSPP
jgi:YVTN family beta-propeller protein